MQRGSLAMVSRILMRLCFIVDSRLYHKHQKMIFLCVLLASAVLLRVHRFASFQCRKLFDGFPYSLLSETQIINTLEIEPELCACSKEVSEAQSGIARDGAGSIQDLCDAIGWHVDLSRQLGGAHVERFQFFRQVFPRMDSRQCHIDAPSDSPQSPH